MSSVLGLPEIEMAEVDCHAFNLAVWECVSADEKLARLNYRIETDKHGQLIMSPLPAPSHGKKQMDIGYILNTLKTNGEVISECPISTTGGVKAADVAWCSDEVWKSTEDQNCLVTCPELCIEVLSPSNTKSEIEEKKQLYFDGGAQEVWICDLNGDFAFYSSPTEVIAGSVLFPEFPKTV